MMPNIVCKCDYDGMMKTILPFFQNNLLFISDKISVICAFLLESTNICVHHFLEFIYSGP